MYFVIRFKYKTKYFNFFKNNYINFVKKKKLYADIADIYIYYHLIFTGILILQFTT